MPIKLSCVVATRNSERFLASALGSIAPAVGPTSATRVEVLIADGGSTDATLSIAERDPRVRIVSRRDSGIYDGMNQALAEATGEFVLILNSDDLLVPGAVADALAALDREPKAGWISSPALFGERLEQATLRRHPRNLTIEGAMFGIPAINARIFRRELLTEIGPIRPELGLAADREFMVRVATSHRAGLSFDQPLYFYRVHQGSHTISGDLEGRRRVYKAEAKLARMLLLDPAGTDDIRRFAQASYALAVLKLRLSGERPEQGQEGIGWRSLRALAPGLRLAWMWRGRLSGY